jgi:putative ABC transport system permease protein
VKGWRPALRIARRSVRRDLKRSILVATMIAVPIAGATLADGLTNAVGGSEHDRARFFGESDGLVTVTDRTTLGEWRLGDPPEAERGSERDPASVDLLGMLPPGSRATAAPDPYLLRLREDERIVRTEMFLFAIGDPLTSHLGRLVSGRLPKGPSEALVTEPLAERLGLLDGDELRRGSTITSDEGPTVTVTGIAIHPYMLSMQAVMAPPGSELTLARTTRAATPTWQYYVDLPPEVTVDDVWPALAAQGVEFQTGRNVEAPLVQQVAPVALVAGLGLLEVVLLAGAAFAVGARRQVRELGLVGANGGTAAHIRRIVLAQGLWLGVIGSLAGLVLGWVVLLAGRPLWERLSDSLIEGWRLSWVGPAVAVSVGVLSGLVAALVPAAGVARMRPVDALTQRFRDSAGGPRLPIVGVVLAGAGIVGVLASGFVARQLVIDYSAATRSGRQAPFPDLNPPIWGVMVTVIMVVVGMFMVSPWLLGTLGRIGSSLPLSGRLAVRDTGRHRHRTVPAILAIMIVVTGSVTLAFSISATTAKDIRTVPDNTIIVTDDPALAGSQITARVREGAEAVAAELPGAATHEIRLVGGWPEGDPSTITFAPTGQAPLTCGGGRSQLGIGTPDMIELATGRPAEPAALRALADGKVLVTEECLVTDGMTKTWTYEAEPLRLPAWYLPVEHDEDTFYLDLPGSFISEEAAKTHGLTPSTEGYAVTHAATATQDEVDAALTAAEDSGLSGRVETDHSSEVNLISLALAAGAGLVTLLGVGVTIALSAAEGRADLATLAAVGAQPRRRRTLAGAQALVISGLGTLLGLMFGVVLGIAVVWLTGLTEIVPPWQNLAITVIVVPLLAVATAMLSTRSALPMVRRLE